MPLFLVPYFAY